MTINKGFGEVAGQKVRTVCEMAGKSGHMTDGVVATRWVAQNRDGKEKSTECGVHGGEESA